MGKSGRMSNERPAHRENSTAEPIGLWYSSTLADRGIPPTGGPMTGSAAPHADNVPLVHLVVDDERAALLKQIAANLPDITLSERHLCDLELLATGAFSPLQGFMTRADYEPVLDRMRLKNGALWPIPICLD